jgi:mycothiol synthase
LAAVDAGDMAVIDLKELGPGERAALTALLERAGAESGHPPLPEPQLLAITHPARTAHEGRIVLAGPGEALAGFAVLSPARDGSTVLHVVVDPAVPSPSLESALIRRAEQEAPSGFPVHLWVMQAGPADDDRAAGEGFVPERDLLQMRVALPLPRDIVAATRPLATRPFEPGRDEGPWVETNNRAFVGHPEQGGWSVDELRERMAADWVELDGFLVADDPDGPGLIGACWTKIHRDRTPVLGEIYVIDVDPRHHGQGWGRSLTVAGLEWLAGRGITIGMLYTDASNEAAVALYRSLGFTVDHVDRSYRRDPPGGAAG